mmetsp:Transcript_651/g.1667  ORF Transcript_651/g.1667 Transcript_651/m.1667 type:complete len:237 (-) Transcript_651:20-730(-)
MEALPLVEPILHWHALVVLLLARNPLLQSLIDLRRVSSTLEGVQDRIAIGCANEHLTTMLAATGLAARAHCCRLAILGFCHGEGKIRNLDLYPFSGRNDDLWWTGETSRSLWLRGHDLRLQLPIHILGVLNLKTLFALLADIGGEFESLCLSHSLDATSRGLQGQRSKTFEYTANLFHGNADVQRTWDLCRQRFPAARCIRAFGFLVLHDPLSRGMEGNSEGDLFLWPHEALRRCN